ncbi:alpha/beta hydrolase [Virgibacillus soli]|uniref:Lysophospholipase n=1 Tax=Paracerasibacillus soli TaxID=480284 RepID=A0ABU5CR79_9BACI|nr:alpha/beta hydrolase [Virgibacillus soli]MDY0408849.1 lysophospholipase [Virgibacillus soli]
MTETFWLQSTTDNIDIYVSAWNHAAKPKAIIQLAHGMVEHIARYEEFANFLTENNFAVFGHDHRGHGQTGLKQGQLGYLSSTDGFDKMVDDLYTVTTYIKSLYADIPIILFGHSMGSFVVRRYIQTYSDDIDGVILSGTGYFPATVSRIGKHFANLFAPQKEAKLFNLLAFGSYNKRIKKSNTAFDWLTRDDIAVEKYMDDPLCGFTPSGRFFYDLMSGLYTIHQESANQAINPTFPILFISGDHDPVGSYGKGVWKVAKLYCDIGFNKVTVQLFPDARHEVLHELNKHDVYEQIYRWIENEVTFSRL